MSDPVKTRERRRSSREKKKMSVRFGPGDLAHSGVTRDFSETGLCLQTSALYPPSTILIMKIDFPEGPATYRGVVRWSRDPSAASRRPLPGKDLPSAMKKNLQGGMGVEYLDALQPAQEPGPAARAEAPRADPPRPETRAPVRRRMGVPPEMSERDLQRSPTRRRQLSTVAGNTFEVFETEHRGALYIRIRQLPLTDGSSQAAFQEAFWTREEADAAVKAFLKDH
jgi:PilZ domain-containing protein